MGSEDPIKFSTNGSRAMEMKQNQSLLDVLAESARCPFISDLRNIKADGRQQLADKLERISSEDYPLPVWNDALDYLISAPPQESPGAAHILLLHHYRNQEDTPLSDSSQGGNDYESE